MAGDFSRSSWNKVKGYSGVLMQQGRVQVDADWNEQLALEGTRAAAQTVDTFGRCGTSKTGDGFKIETMPDGADLIIHPGRYWVEGLLCELAPQKIPVAGSTSSPTQVQVPSLLVDNRALAAGDWVVVSEHGGTRVQAQVTAVNTTAVTGAADAIVPSFFVLTLSKSIGGLDRHNLWLERVATLTTQPFLVDSGESSLLTSPAEGVGTLLELPQGDYVAVLKAWQREVNALEDPHIREVALGGPDTCARLQNVWQVLLVPYGGESSPLESSPAGKTIDCCSPFPGLDAYQAGLTTTGLMNAQVAQGSQSPPPCLPITPTGYLGVSNQLYRVEVFQPGKANDQATIVWSRDNAMVETTIVCIDSAGNVYASDLGKDDLHNFGLNDYVEIVDPDGDLQGLPRFLAQITKTPIASVQPSCSPGSAPAYQVSLQPAPPSRFQGKSNLRLRRWDMPATQTMATDASGNPQGVQIATGWTQLENNIEVNFSDGHYATGSYWQIPARTATGDIEWAPFQVPNTNPIPQPPMGIAYRFCRLALVTVNAAGEWKVTDCRCRFPSLTDICAEDICYHGTGCELEPVSTLTDALDELGARIRYHNKMLHGSGVVCGLAVSCGSGTKVSVAPGYAIDCEGYDLRLEATATVDLARAVTHSPQQSQLEDGNYELILERGLEDLPEIGRGLELHLGDASSSERGCCSKSKSSATLRSCVTFRAVPCEKEPFLKEWLDGTLLKDFVTHCLLPMMDRFKSEYVSQFISSDKQVTKAQALVSSLTNLLVQLVKPALNEVFLSQAEARLLEEFYAWLKGLIGRGSLCTPASRLPAFPQYGALSESKMQTIFGKGMKTRLRVAVEKNLGYAMGGNGEIQIFDLNTKQLANVVPMPVPGGISGWVVQDIAIAPNGDIFAVATSGSDSYFAQGTVEANFSVTWRLKGSLGALAFHSLTMVLSTEQAGVYATVPGEGIYFINVSTGQPRAHRFVTACVTGQIVSWGSELFVPTSSKNQQGTFDRVESYRALRDTNNGNEPASFIYPLSGHQGDLTDDLIICQAKGSEPLGMVVSALRPATGYKELMWFTNLQGYQPGAVNPAAPRAIALGTDTTVRLAMLARNGELSGSVMVSLEDTCQLMSLRLEQEISELSKYQPTELHPVSLAMGDETGDLYVLNSTANTITLVPRGIAPYSNALQVDLERYRIAALEAFVAVFLELAQSLKDRFCKLLLPQCPVCEEGEQGVALACVTVTDGVVAKICNLEKRKYVKTFPTVGYWLSLLPVIPLVKVLIEDLCCVVFAEVWKPPTKSHTAVVAANGDQMRGAFAKLAGMRPATLLAAAQQRLSPAGKMTLDAIGAVFKPASAAAQSTVPPMKMSDLVGQPLSDAQASLAAQKITVTATEAYDPTAFVSNIAAYAAGLGSLAPGSSVALAVDDQQQVRYVVPTPPAVAALSATVVANQTALKQQIEALPLQEIEDRLNVDEASIKAVDLHTQVATLETQLGSLQAAHTAALAARDEQIAALTSSTQQLQTRLAAMDELSAQVQTLAARMPVVKAKPKAAKG